MWLTGLSVPPKPKKKEKIQYIAFFDSKKCYDTYNNRRLDEIRWTAHGQIRVTVASNVW